MPQDDSSTMLVLQCAAVGLMLVLAVLLLGVRVRLRRIERWMAELAGCPKDAAAQPTAEETSPGGAFELFLNEEPSRRHLPKAEQFAEYRRWRNDRGLNWTKS